MTTASDTTRTRTARIDRETGARRLGAAVGGLAVVASTVVVIVGIAILPFFNPWWLGLEQDRGGAAALTGWTPDQVRSATDGLLHDLVLGPPDFAMTVAGQPVFDARERAHMRDVRGVFAGFGLAAVAGLATLLLLWRVAGRRRWFWRSLSTGGALAAAAVIVLGAFFAVAFDTAFDLFHRLFFPAGSYDFDVGSERLVQLLPERLWYETTLAFGAVVFALGLLAAALARRRAAAAGDRR
ncbi:MAG TPA: DUF1461 domain-containing protein [Candidatus Limnocylindrales bacterium]